MKNQNLLPADILLPKEKFESFSVIACDQYTSEPEYWQDVKTIVGDDVSAFNLILPEVYLSNDNKDAVDKINATMKKYIESGKLECFKDAMVYVERETATGIRKGIVGLIDLACYDFNKGSMSRIRATEETVLERIPPRIEIRKNAPLELPHIMLLIDDPDSTVISPVTLNKGKMQKLYDFSLMKNGGNIKGYLINSALQEKINNALENLAPDKNDMLFAVGDGNHSLATAKACYELNGNNLNRYALVEVVNIHDSSLIFEPIYRVLFNVNPEEVIEEFVGFCGGEYNGDGAQMFACYFGENQKEFSVAPKLKLAVGTLQTFLDKYLKEHSEAVIDYIHGEDSLKKLSQKENALGFIFEGMKKSELFPAVIKDGSLPRKTFSMGHADDKRFYLEARVIK